MVVCGMHVCHCGCHVLVFTCGPSTERCGCTNMCKCVEGCVVGNTSTHTSTYTHTHGGF